MKALHTLKTAAVTAVLIAGAALALAQPASAQPGPQGPPNAQHQERMREIRGKVLRQEAKLDEAAAAKTEKVLSAFDEERKAAHRREGDARKALHGLVQADSKDEKAYKDALDALVAAHEGVVKLRVRELDELRKSLGQRDAARVVVALPSIQRQMRQLMKEGRKAWLREQLNRLEDDDDGDAPPPPPPPGPPPPRAPGKGKGKLIQ